MILTCDIGNTNIKSGLFIDDKLSEFKIFTSVEEFVLYINTLTITTITVSSVVPVKLDEIKNTLGSKFTILEITKESSFNLKIDYESPDTLGIDRICSCEGAFYLFKNSTDFKTYSEKTFLITIDFGTATTINIVKYPGEFIGGIISPGLRLMFDCLTIKTAQLPKTDAWNYRTLIGKTTRQSIASGIVNSKIGLIERTINDLKKEQGAENIKIFITGGNAEVILPYFEFDFFYEKALVLYGIKALFDRIK